MARKSKQSKAIIKQPTAHKTPVQKERQLSSLDKKVKSPASKLVAKSESSFLPQQTWPYLLFIALLSFMAYFNSFYNELIMNWDDAGYIVNNTFIQNLSIESIKAMFSKFYMHNYHPLTTLSYALEYAISETNPFIYHVNNFILHLLNAFLVFVLVRKLTNEQRLLPFFVALLFAVHPMHVESVAWISERKDVLYTFFFLLSLIAYLKYIDSENRSWRYLGFALLFFLGSLMSKSAAVTLAPVLLLIDYFRHRAFNGRLLLEKVPFFAFSLLFGMLAISSQDTAIQDLTPMLTFAERLMISMFAFVTYLYKALLPLNLSAMYAYPIKVDNQLPMVYYLMPIVVAAIAFALWRMRKSRILVFGFLFFLFNIGLVLQLVPVGGVILSERYTYVPYIGLLLLLAWPLTLLKNNSKNLYAVFLLLLAIAFSVLSFDRVKYWKNGDVLFTDVIKKYPLLPYAYNNRGFLYWDYYAVKVYKDLPAQKDVYVRKAYADFTMALQLDPTYTEAFSNRAVLLFNTGRIEESLIDFNALLRLDSINIDGLLGRANTLSTLKRFEESLKDYSAYLRQKPDDARALIWRATAYTNTGRYEAASMDLRKSAAINPNDHEVWYWMGLGHFKQARFDSALVYFDKTISLKSDFAEVFSWKGLTHFNMHHYTMAVESYNEAIRLNPKDAAALVNRAVSLYQLGRYDEVIRDLDAAMTLGFSVNRDFYMAAKAHKSGFKVH